MREIVLFVRQVFLTVLAVSMFGTIATAQSIETKSLEQLYADALAEGGEFVLRAGGDKPDQIDYYLNKFKARFPELKVTHSVDVSLNHAPRYDNAREAGGQVNVPDVIQFQSLHDFEYYKEHDLLERYKPANWDKVFPDHRDPNGYWTAMYGVTFSNFVNTDMLGEDFPRDALDYLKPSLKGKIILTYPHDDDAVLYQFWNLKEQYGWEYLEKLVANEPVWVQAKNKAAAKLYMNWMLSEEMQGTWLQFPVRYDIQPPAGYKSGLHYNTSPGDFRRWMMRRDQVERFRLQMRLLIGEAEGPTPVDIDFSVKPE